MGMAHRVNDRFGSKMVRKSWRANNINHFKLFIAFVEWIILLMLESCSTTQLLHLGEYSTFQAEKRDVDQKPFADAHVQQEL